MIAAILFIALIAVCCLLWLAEQWYRIQEGSDD